MDSDICLASEKTLRRKGDGLRNGHAIILS